MNLRRAAHRLRRRLGWLSVVERAQRWTSARLPATTCVDVGASYFPHTRWEVFLHSPATRWVAVEPNEANLGYLANWPWAARVSPCRTGLSEHGGTQTLFVTNVDSGSSLLRPEIAPGMARRFRNPGYFFPLVERPIETLTLLQAIDGAGGAPPLLVKLDTQGTELSILRGADSLLQSHDIVAVEMEATLLAQPVMSGSGRFWQAAEFFEARGYELVHLDPIRAAPPSARAARAGLRSFLNECDAVFMLRSDVASERPLGHRAALIGAYMTYRLFEDALAMLEADRELRVAFEAEAPGGLLSLLRRALA